MGRDQAFINFLYVGTAVVIGGRKGGLLRFVQQRFVGVRVSYCVTRVEAQWMRLTSTETSLRFDLP